MPQSKFRDIWRIMGVALHRDFLVSSNPSQGKAAPTINQAEASFGELNPNILKTYRQSFAKILILSGCPAPQ
jgi:hypothetical protein